LTVFVFAEAAVLIMLGLLACNVISTNALIALIKAKRVVSLSLVAQVLNEFVFVVRQKLNSPDSSSSCPRAGEIAANKVAADAAIARFGQVDDYYILDKVTVYFGNGQVKVDPKYNSELVALAGKAKTVKDIMQQQGHIPFTNRRGPELLRRGKSFTEQRHRRHLRLSTSRPSNWT
jgi:hypothetical protein